MKYKVCYPDNMYEFEGDWDGLRLFEGDKPFLAPTIRLSENGERLCFDPRSIIIEENEGNRRQMYDPRVMIRFAADLEEALAEWGEEWIETALGTYGPTSNGNDPTTT